MAPSAPGTAALLSRGGLRSGGTPWVAFGRYVAVAAMATMLAIAGCDLADHGEQVEVEGRVTCGGEPVRGADVFLVSGSLLAGKEKAVAITRTDDRGAYRVTHSDEDGCSDLEWRVEAELQLDYVRGAEAFVEHCGTSQLQNLELCD